MEPLTTQRGAARGGGRQGGRERGGARRGGETRRWSRTRDGAGPDKGWGGAGRGGEARRKAWGRMDISECWQGVGGRPLKTFF